mgnify:CR=1 FL=1
MNYIEQYFKETKSILGNIKIDQIRLMVNLLINVKVSGGRLFILGVGGGAGHAEASCCADALGR